MLDGIDSIDWASLVHAYGNAADVPELLRALASSDEEKRRSSRWQRRAGCAQRHVEQHHQTSRPEMRAIMEQTKSYAYVIERSDDGSYWAYLPDLPGCATTGESPEQVEQQLHEAVDLYLSYYHDRGLSPPAPQARVGTLTAA